MSSVNEWVAAVVSLQLKQTNKHLQMSDFHFCTGVSKKLSNIRDLEMTQRLRLRSS